MHLEYFLTLGQIRQIHVYLSVETAGAKKCLVEHIGTVCGCEYYYAAVCSETVHLCKKGVERVFALVVAAHCWVFAACATHCINLVDEYYARCFLLGLSEKVAYTACAYAHEHLHEVGTAH